MRCYDHLLQLSTLQYVLLACRESTWPLDSVRNLKDEGDTLFHLLECTQSLLGKEMLSTDLISLSRLSNDG